MNPLPSAAAIGPTDDEALRSMLSALMDGQAGPVTVQQGCAQWRDDPAARATWHAYHLIGDVMRSDDLASAPVRDAAFLSALRARLADELTVLAPAPLAAAPHRRPRWLLPTAVAAGFVAVAGVLVVSRLSAPEPAGGPLLAGQAPVVAGVQRVGTAPAASQPLAVDGRVIRDAGLDAYLRAHRDMRGGAAAALPGGALRSVETTTLQR